MARLMTRQLDRDACVASPWAGALKSDSFPPIVRRFQPVRVARITTDCTGERERPVDDGKSSTRSP